MTHTETHSPLPWSAHRTPENGNMRKNYSQSHAVLSSSTLIAGCFMDVQGGEDMAKANAELIARSVNALPSLVEALEMVIGSTKFDVDDDTTREVTRRIRAALALAKGE